MADWGTGRPEFEEFLTACFDALRAEDQSVLDLFPISEPVSDWEAEWFFRGLRDLGVFRVAPRTEVGKQSFASWVLSEAFTDREGRPANVHLLETAGRRDFGVRKVRREAITHLAALSRLIGEFGHDISKVRSPWTDAAIDIVVYDRPARDPEPQAVIAAEVTVTGEEVEELVAGLRECGGLLDEHGHADAVATRHGRKAKHAANHHKKSNHHKRCLWLGRSAACVFWAVSRDSSRVFRVHRQAEGGYRLEEVDEQALTTGSCG